VYLTRAFLNPRRRGAFRLLGNPQTMHAAILACFPEQPVQPADGTSARVMWRLDLDNPHRPALWLVSPRQPDLTSLIEHAGWPEADQKQWRTQPYESLLNRLSKGDRFAFRLTANPTRSVRVEDGASRTRRVEHVTAAHQVQWLMGQATRHGFCILGSSATQPGTQDAALDLRLLRRDKLRFRRSGSSRSRSARGDVAEHKPVTIVQVAYEGGMEVTDPDRLKSALTSGIGRGRAYGCGLLTLAPLLQHRPANEHT
jgi:CRISPR system Cascade subunit CasE